MQRCVISSLVVISQFIFPIYLRKNLDIGWRGSDFSAACYAAHMLSTWRYIIGLLSDKLSKISNSYLPKNFGFNCPKWHFYIDLHSFLHFLNESQPPQLFLLLLIRGCQENLVVSDSFLIKKQIYNKRFIKKLLIRFL